MDYRAFFALLLLSILSSAYVQSAPLLNTLSASVDSTCLVIQPVSGDNSNTKFESTYNAESGDAKIFAVLTTASVSASLTIRLGSGSSVSLGDGVSSDSYSLSQGSNVFTVEAIDSSIKTIYEFTIHLLSTNNKIKSLSFFDSSIDLTPNDFSSSITSYTLSTRPSTVSTIELKSLILDSQYAQWSLTSTSGDVCTSLSSPCIIKLLTKGGVTNITITVTPKRQTPTKVYTFTIRRQSDLSLINTLSAAFSGQCLDISRQGTDLSFTAGATFDADQSPSPTIYITAKLTKATKESGAVLKIGPKDGSLTAAADNMPFAFSAVPGENKIAVTVFPEDPNVTPTTYLLTVTLASTHATLLSATIKHSITSNGAESDPLTGPASITISAGTTDYSGFTVPSASAYAVVRVTLQDRYASVWSGTTSGSLTKCSDLSATHSVHLESFNGRYSRSSYRSSAFSYTTNTYKCVVPLMANGAVSDVIVQGVAADGVTKTSEYKFAIYRQSSLTKIHTLRAAFDDSCATINATDEANHFIIVSNLQHANLFIAASLTTLTALKGAVMTLTVGTASPIGLSDSSYSSAIPVSVGKTVLIISVTAEDSSIHQDYKVTVHLRSNDNAITDAKVAIGDSVDTLTTDGVMNQQMIEGSKLEYTGIKVKSSVKFIGLKHVTLSFAAASVKLVNGSTITDCKSSFGTEVRKHIRAVNPFARHSFVPLAPVSFSYDCGVIALNDAGNSTVLRIRVIPESITPTQDYIWTVYRQSNNVNIQSITASAAGSCLTVEKYAADDDYHYKAVANTPGAAYVTVKLSAAAASSNAVYVIGPRGTTGVSAADNVKSGPYSVIEGDNFIEITVTAEDTAVQRKYHLKFHVQSSVATLDAGATLQFLDGNSYVSTTTQIVAGTYSYTAITLPSTSTSVRFIGLSLTNSFANAVIRTKGNPNVACTAQYQNVETTTVHHIFTTASYSIVCDAVTIGAGGSTTTVELQVTAENGSDQKIYSFAVYRSLGASLKSLVVTKISDATPFSLTPSFSSSIQDYFLAVAYEVSSVIIIANVTDPSKQAVELNFEDYNPNNATATPYRLSLGDNIFNITVIAEDALSQMQYSIVIRRSLHINGALLSSLTLNGVEISPAFYNGIHSYTATVAASVAYFTVVAVPSDTNAKVEVSLTPQSPSYQRLNASDQYTSGPLYLDAAPSSNNLTIIVTASDAITKLSYFVVVHRQSPVSIQGDPLLTGFNGQTYNVHGIPDEYFNLISAQNLQLNALFTFIAKDDRDKDATPDAIKSIGAWHTAGTYITDIAIRLSSDALRITVEDSIPSSSSLASHQKLKGLVVQSGSSVTRRLMISFNGRNLTDHLKVGETISLNTLHDAKSTTKHHFSIIKRSAHEFRIVTQLLLIDISRAGSHMNIEARVKEGIDITRPAVSSRLSSMHGLLGQMWAREQKHSKDNLDLSEALLLDDSDLIDGRVDDYLISDGPFGINFAFNKFIDQKKNEKDLTI